jgi:indolepyruvate ferredoxin oxidoreductase beta subunit
MKEANVKEANIILVGTGGQGLVRLSEIMARAAILQGINARMYEHRGMAQRGGSVRCEIKLGDGQTSVVPEGSADFIISMELLETLRYMDKLKRNGVVIINPRKIIPFREQIKRKPKYPSEEEVYGLLRAAGATVIPVDAEKIATDLGLSLAANMVMLGAFAGLKPIRNWIKKDSFIFALEGEIKRKKEENIKAFESGYAITGGK